MAPPLTKDRRLFFKILEAKNFPSNGDKNPDTFVEVALRNQPIKRTSTITNNNNPFFGEEFTFDPITSENDLSMTIAAYLETTNTSNGQKANTVLGQITLTKTFLMESTDTAGGERWFVLHGLNSGKSLSMGEVTVRIRYDDGSEEDDGSQIIVEVVSVSQLRVEGKRDPEPSVLIRVLPDGKETFETRIKKGRSVQYDQKFVCPIKTLRSNHEIEFVVVNNVGCDGDATPLGTSTIQVNHLLSGTEIEATLPLLPFRENNKKENLFDGFKNVIQSIQGSNNSLNNVANSTTSLNNVSANTVTKVAHKFAESSLQTSSLCGHCGNMIFALTKHMQCVTCKYPCHQRCAKQASKNCEGVPMVRVKYHYSEISVLPYEHYVEFVDSLLDNNCTLIPVLNKVMTDREDVANSLVRILSYLGKSVTCMNTLMEGEIKSTPSSTTLFRGATIVTKALDVYMRFMGLEYLQSVLEEPIMRIIESKTEVELDPMRKSPNVDIKTSAIQVQEYLTIFLNRIVSSLDRMPLEFRKVYAHMFRVAQRQYPNEPETPFIAVSSFLFLRYFVPAILSPKLFGMCTGVHIDKSACRTLTLVAKAIQSLSNLVEFGQKEAYMMPLNSFIRDKLPTMRLYLINVLDVVTAEANGCMELAAVVKVEQQEAAKYCARLVQRVYTIGPKINTKAESPAIVDSVKHLLKLCESLVSAVESDGNGSAAADVSTNLPMITSGKSSTSSRRKRFSVENAIRIPMRAANSGVIGEGSSNTFESLESSLQASDVLMTPLEVKVANHFALRRKSSLGGFQSTSTGNTLDGSHNLREKRNSATIQPLGKDFMSKLVESMLSDIQEKPDNSLNATQKSIGKVDKEHNMDDKQLADELSNIRFNDTFRQANNTLTTIPASSRNSTFLESTMLTTLTSSPSFQISEKRNSILSGITGSSSNRAISEAGKELPGPPTPQKDSPLSHASSSNRPSPINTSNSLSPINTHINSFLESSPTANTPSCKSKAELLHIVNAALDNIQTPIDSVSCGKCHQGISSAPLSGQDVIYFGNTWWHTKCFSCITCQSGGQSSIEPITQDTAFFEQGHLYCPFHYERTFDEQWKCVRCHEPVFEEKDYMMISENATSETKLPVHRQCFRCEMCDTCLENGFVAVDGYYLCKEDYLRLAGMVCGTCGDFIESAYIDIKGTKYHTHCKKCDKCGQQIAGHDYFCLLDKTFCSSHAEDVLSCSGCHKPLDDDVSSNGSSSEIIVGLDSKNGSIRCFHLCCNSCAFCKKSLEGIRFYWMEGKKSAACYHCYVEAL